MTKYTLICDEAHYVESAYNEEMEQVEREIVGTEGLEMCESYYWITANDRDIKLEVRDFMMGEEILQKLSSGELEDLEEAEEEYRLASVKEQRPPY